MLAMIAKQPDRTLDEIIAVMRKRRIPGSRTALWRFLDRHRLTFKESLRAAEQHRADVARARRQWIRQQLAGPQPDSRGSADRLSNLSQRFAVWDEVPDAFEGIPRALVPLELPREFASSRLTLSQCVELDAIERWTPRAGQDDDKNVVH
jgi:hypothetical protein